MYNRFILLLSLLCLASLNAQDMQKGFNYLESGNYVEAETFFSEILTDYPAIKLYLDRITERHASLLRFVALIEITLMPTLILSIFVARSNLLLIFLYYRFLTLRYTSHRNPYTRTLFYEIRQYVEYFCSQPTCPTFIARICYSVIAFINRLAPVAG